MKLISTTFFSLLIISSLFLASCGDDGDDGLDVNASPEVSNPIQDQSFMEGFGTSTISLANVFTDSDGDNLNYTATINSSRVVTVAVSGSTLTITERGEGNAVVTVNASDGSGGSASDEFSVSVTESTPCANDNSTDQDNTVCDNTPTESNVYMESVSGGMRTIRTNRVPDHDYGNQIANMGVTRLVSTTETFTFAANPSVASNITNIITDENRPAFDYGIGLNGVPIDPAPGTPFIFTIDDPGNPNDGEFNWDWVFEPNNNRSDVGLDCNTAHLQPTSNSAEGLIHYHGDMVVYANGLLAGLGDGTTTPTSPVQIGWGSDGFPIVYKYGPASNGSGVELLEPSWQLKSGERPGDGLTEPCGPYNGKYTNDYEFISGSGDLDECNGIERTITLTTPAGGSETFSYFYVITDEFPVIGRCLSGTPASDFSKVP